MAVYSVFQPIIIAMLYKFSLHFFFFFFFFFFFWTKYIVIFKICMDNWEMILANLEQMVRKEKGMMNGMV